MPEYLHPGVYIEEVSSGVRPIEGTSTSTAAFVGLTARGVPNRATFITSYAEFVRRFGDLTAGSFLPYAVQQFFGNGGKRCYVVRVLNTASASTSGEDFPDRETDGGPRSVLRIDAGGAGDWGDAVMVEVQDGTENPTREFKLLVYHQGPVPVEVFDNLSMDPASDRYVVTAVNDASGFIRVRDLGNRTNPVRATATSTAPLADPVVINAGGETVSLETADGTVNTVNLAAGNLPRTDLLTLLNTAWAPLNVTAFLTTADEAPANRLRVRHNAPGFDRYFILGGTATAAGRPLAGLAGFQQGSGAATGGILKSAPAPDFDTTGGNNVLTITVNGDALPAINLPVNAAAPIDDVRAAIQAALAATANGLVTVSREGDRLVLATANAGNAADTDLAVAGTADTPLQFRTLARAAGPATGQGRSEHAFVQSGPGPFALANNSNLRFRVNNGALGAPGADVVVSFASPAIPNLASVSAATVAGTINTAAAGAVVASVVNNRVRVRQSRRGRAYTLQVIDGAGAPNVQLQFGTDVEHGWHEGDPDSPFYRPGFNPDALGVNQPRPLVGGDDGSAPSNFDFVGSSATRTGLHALDDVQDVNFIAIPGNFSEQVIGAGVGYCQARKDCFFIADSRHEDPVVEDPSRAQDFVRNRIPVKSSYGALYYPWLEIADPIGPGRNPRRFVPPSGFVAGLFARIDNTRGVWKAPAGTEANLIGPLALEYAVTDSEQDVLHPYGVNCIRQFPAAGMVIWGARTLATQSDPEYRYVPVRRYTIYLEVSIYRGTQWAVHEPNDATLWESLEANIGDFMMGEFRRGALAGATPEQAFEVKCDEDLNPPSEVNAGRVNMEVRFAPLKPAEFVIIRISQKIQRPEA
ncbi:MAG TPA: phage tail sheath subtilisin-like domain-containing protein [Longimicrobium sp.]